MKSVLVSYLGLREGVLIAVKQDSQHGRLV